MSTCSKAPGLVGDRSHKSTPWPRMGGPLAHRHLIDTTCMRSYQLWEMHTSSNLPADVKQTVFHSNLCIHPLDYTESDRGRITTQKSPNRTSPLQNTIIKTGWRARGSNPGRTRSPLGPNLPPIQSVPRIFSWGKALWGEMLATHLPVEPRLRMCGVTPLFPLYASQSWTGTTLFFTLQISRSQSELDSHDQELWNVDLNLSPT
jgi:hypothetical protein